MRVYVWLQPTNRMAIYQKFKLNEWIRTFLVRLTVLYVSKAMLLMVVSQVAQGIRWSSHMLQTIDEGLCIANSQYLSLNQL